MAGIWIEFVQAQLIESNGKPEKMLQAITTTQATTAIHLMQWSMLPYLIGITTFLGTNYKMCVLQFRIFTLWYLQQ